MTFLVMEYLSGRDLGQVLKEEGALSFDRVARIAVQVCGSVAQAHERGIVHRDLKPENIMVLDRASGRGAHARDVVKVLDFGLAKLRETEEAGEKSLTRAGAILGTPYYMAPEHIRGEAVDARSDVYAMGALMYKAITGEPPFSASSPVGVQTMHLTEEVVPPSRKRPGVPEDADRIVLRAMAKDPRDRFQSMEQLRAELSAYLAAIGDHEGIETVRVSRIGGGTLPTESGRQREVATRSDVDEYERSLRRRNIAGYAVALVLAAGLAAGGGWAWTQRPAPSATEESEPNNVLTQADALPEGQALQAYLGKRIDEERSDADFYAIRNAAGTPRPIRIEVSAIPNMDLVVELFREGISTPVLIAGSGGVGMAEIVPNFVIDGATYYLRVREVWESGAWPTENVSDPYTVRWFGVTLEENDERELNDSLELADTIGVPGIRRGYIGWGGDQDGYCLDEDAMDIVARVEAPSTLDLVLEVVDRAKGRVTTIDANGVGEGEESSVIASGAAGSLCFVVSARRPPGQPANDPDQRYVLRVERAAEPAPEGSP
jgi:serine/threonine-protein kinase